MRKVIVLAIVCVFAFALAACGKDSGDDAKKNETKVTATPSPTATSAPTPSEAEEPTPTVEPAKTTTEVRHIIQNPSDNQGIIVINSLVMAPSNSILYVIVRKTGETTGDQTGRAIGGFVLDNSSKLFDYEFVLDHDPEMSEEIRIPFTLTDLLSIAKVNPDAADAHKVVIKITDSAYTFDGVDLEFEK
ncbi:MAG: hypothetical protein K6E71_03890 [Lachnospiraceae bacterium]|nr:hypothetical protein [Lachnospiraceae bacterium]